MRKAFYVFSAGGLIDVFSAPICYLLENLLRILPAPQPSGLMQAAAARGRGARGTSGETGGLRNNPGLPKDLAFSYHTLAASQQVKVQGQLSVCLHSGEIQ